jgi:hypothetical protein
MAAMPGRASLIMAAIPWPVRHRCRRRPPFPPPTGRPGRDAERRAPDQPAARRGDIPVGRADEHRPRATCDLISRSTGIRPAVGRLDGPIRNTSEWIDRPGRAQHHRMHLGAARVSSRSRSARRSATIARQTIVIAARRRRPARSGARRWVRAAPGQPDGSNWMFTKANGVLDLYRWLPWVSRRIAFDRQSRDPLRA